MIKALNHLTLAVTELERSFVFYRELLGFKPLVKWDQGAYFLVGDEKDGLWFCLNVDPKRISTPCYTHYAFTIDAKNFALMAARIRNSGTKIFKHNTSPGASLYFLDPDGHKLEIHVGNWHTRVTVKQAVPGNWKNVEWFI